MSEKIKIERSEFAAVILAAAFVFAPLTAAVIARLTGSDWQHTIAKQSEQNSGNAFFNTHGSLILNALTLGVLIWQAKIYARQAIISERQVSISQKQIETVERLERPLLLIIPPRWYLGYRDDPVKSAFPSFDVDFRNYGRSPAIISCWHVSIVISSHEPNRERYRNDYFLTKPRGESYGVIFYVKNIPSDSTVAPDETMGSSGIAETPLTGGQANAIATGESKVWLDGVMCYEDVFGAKRETHFRWVYDTKFDFFIRHGSQFNRYT